MPTGYPTSIDAFPDPTPTTPMNTPGALEHDIQHSNANDAINTMQIKIGVNGSTDVTSIDKKLATVISAQAADAAAITVANGNISANTTNITNLLSANPSSPSDGVVFIAATATAGTAINSAIASFGGTKGVVQLGKGTFTLDVQVPMADNVTIRGMGRSSTFLVFNPASFSPALGGGTTPISRVRLENLRVQSTTDGSGVAIDLGYVNYAVVSGVDVGASGAYPNKGIDFSINNNSSRPYYNVIRDCYVAVGGASPIGIDLTNQANSNVVDNVRVDMPGATLSGTPVGVRIAGPTRASHSILLMHLDVESVATATGVLTQNSSYNIMMVDCYFEAINKCIQIDAGSANVTGVGCYLYNWGTNNVLDNSGATGGDISITGMGSLAAGAGTAVPFNYRSNPGPIVFAASGSLTAAQCFGASAIKFYGVNGGGGAGGNPLTGAATSAGGGSGGGGAYAEKTIGTTGLAFPLQVTVGAAGTAGAATPTAGGKGGQSIVKDNNGAGATLWTPGVQAANQGGGIGVAAGTVGVAAATQGGFDVTVTSSVADLVVLGGAGQPTFRIDATHVLPVPGGGSFLAGYSAYSSTPNGAGGSGQLYGGGGASTSMSNAAASVGTAGAAGVVIAELIF